MPASTISLDAHQKPPQRMRALFKQYQKLSPDELSNDPNVFDFRNLSESCRARLCQANSIPSPLVPHAFEDFKSVACPDGSQKTSLGADHDAPVYEITTLPGLLIAPSLLSPVVQIELLNRLLHRDLSNPSHRTNLHLHHDIPYDVLNKDPAPSNENWNQSFFNGDPNISFLPKDASIHKELSLDQVLKRKLRWVTLGGQYDWTAKQYPSGTPPRFPTDISHLLRNLFPEFDPQAAILNFYSPGDTLSVHRDVSEECDRELVSISFGCEGIFLVGNQDASQTATIRLRSGDAVVMSQTSRYAWHGVSKVLAGTCPEWLQDWPATGLSYPTYDLWKGWMSAKRINLNVRQMRESG